MEGILWTWSAISRYPTKRKRQQDVTWANDHVNWYLGRTKLYKQFCTRILFCISYSHEPSLIKIPEEEFGQKKNLWRTQLTQFLTTNSNTVTLNHLNTIQWDMCSVTIFWRNLINRFDKPEPGDYIHVSKWLNRGGSLFLFIAVNWWDIMGRFITGIWFSISNK